MTLDKTSGPDESPDSGRDQVPANVSSLPGAGQASTITRDMALSRRPRNYEYIDVPEWGGRVRLRTLTGTERDAFEETIVRRRGQSVQTNMKFLRARLIAFTAVDDNGQLLFSEPDIPELSEQPAYILDRVFSRAQEMNGFTERDVESLAGNSEEPNGNSGSLLPRV